MASGTFRVLHEAALLIPARTSRVTEVSFRNDRWVYSELQEQKVWLNPFQKPVRADPSISTEPVLGGAKTCCSLNEATLWAVWPPVPSPCPDGPPQGVSGVAAVSLLPNTGPAWLGTATVLWDAGSAPSPPRLEMLVSSEWLALAPPLLPPAPGCVWTRAMGAVFALCCRTPRKDPNLPRLPTSCLLIPVAGGSQSPSTPASLSMKSNYPPIIVPLACTPAQSGPGAFEAFLKRPEVRLRPQLSAVTVTRRLREAAGL